MFKIGKYEICFLDLITNSRTGKLDSSKIGSIGGQVILSYTFLNIANPTDMQMIAYGSIMGGTYLLRRYMDAKGGKNDKSIES